MNWCSKRKMKLLLLLLLSMVMVVVKGQQCYQPGECKLSTVVGGSVADSYNDCLEHCRQHMSCSWFTFYSVDNDCLLFSDCSGGGLDPSECNNCWSGEKECQPRETLCHIQGFCSGHLLQFDHSESENECLRRCKATTGCNFYTHDSAVKFCYLLTDCDSLDATCDTCRSGEADCALSYTKLMVVSGFPEQLFRDVEVIDLASEDANCLKPADFPGDYRGSAGTYVDGNPLVCGGGGGGKTNSCYKYLKSSNAWTPAPSMQLPRYMAAGVMINESAWWVTGGEGGGFTTELYSAESDSWSPFADLPQPDSGHCILKVNATHLFMIGGVERQAYYFFDTVTLEWTLVGEEPFSRYLPTCGVVTRGDGEVEVVLAGGSAYTSSQILSLTTLKWREGPNLPHPMGGAFGVQFGNTFVAVGGFNELTQEVYDTILLFDNDEWIELPQHLQSPRSVYTAFLVADDAVDCS